MPNNDSFDIRVFKRAGAWSMGYTFNGERNYDHGNPTREEAKQKGLEKTVHLQRKEMHFKAFLEDYYPLYESGLKKKTAEIHRRAFSCLLSAVDQELLLKDITHQVADDILKAVAKYPQQTKAILNACIKYAVKLELLDHQPAIRNKPRLGKAKVLNGYPRKYVDAISREFANSDVQLEWELGRSLKLTEQEIYGLQFSDFSKDYRIVRIKRMVCMVRQYNEDGTCIGQTPQIKELDAGQEREVEVPEFIAELMSERSKILCTSKYRKVDNDFVCARTDGKIRGGNFLDKKLKEIQQKIEAPRMTFNNLIKAQILD